MLGLGLSLSLGNGRGGGGVIPGAVPVNVTPPTITGDLLDGSTLTANPGTWTNTPTGYTIQWYRDGAALGAPVVIAAGDPAPTRPYVGADDVGRELTFDVIATNGDGDSVEAISPVRIGLYDPLIYETDFTNASLAQLKVQPGWTGNGVYDDTVFKVSPAGLVQDYGVSEGCAVYRTTGTNATVKWKPARPSGAPTGQTGRYYFPLYDGPTTYIALAVQYNGFSLTETVSGVPGFSGSGFGFDNQEGTEWATVLNVVSGVRYIRVLRRDWATLEWAEVPTSIAANGGLGFGPVNVAIVGTKAAVSGGLGADGALHSLGMRVEVPQVNSVSLAVGTPVQSPDDPNKQRVPLTITFSGTADNAEVAVLDPDGFSVQTWAADVGYVDLSYAPGEFTFLARDPDMPVTAVSVAAELAVLPIFGDAVMGVNEAFVNQWNSMLPFANTGDQCSWAGPDYTLINSRSAPPNSGGIYRSADGEGGTVKGDLDGRIYGYNTAGLTQYMLITPFFHPAAGDYTVQLVPGLSVSLKNGTRPWTYNNTSGVLTYTVASTDEEILNILIATSSIPVGGIPRPSGHLVGTAPATYEMGALAATSIPEIADVMRFMSPSGVNNWNNGEGGRTDTALPVDTPANMWTGNIGSNMIGGPRHAAHYSAAGLGLWYTEKHTAGDVLVSSNAALLASASAVALMLFERSNEVWNDLFATQHNDTALAGVRAGYAPDAVTTHAAATPETIIDASPYVAPDNRLVSGRSFSPGDKIYVIWWGMGTFVAAVTATINPGDTLAIGTNISVLYDGVKTARARKRFHGYDSRRMFRLVKAEFIAAGKPAPLHVIAWHAASGFDGVRDILDFDDVHLEVDRVSAGFYWGGGIAGADYGPYDSTYGGWTEAQRDLWYAGNSSGFITAACAAFGTGINATVALAYEYSRQLAIYSLEKRGDKDAIRFNNYEISHHIQFRGYPDMAGAWSNSTAYANKQFVWSNPATGGDGKTYRAKLDVPAGTALSNATYWGVFVDGNGATWDAAKTNLHRDSAPRGYQAAWNALSRSPEFAERQDYFFGRITAETGVKEVMFFDRGGKPAILATGRTTQADPINGWQLQYNEADTAVSGGGENYQFSMLKDLKASLS